MTTKIRQSSLDASVVTGNTTLSSAAADTDLILVYDQSAGGLKQISRKNFVGFPTITSVSPTSVTSGDGTGNYTFTVTGTGFTGSTAKFKNTSGTDIAADTVTVNSDTQITMVIAKSSLPGSGEPYDIAVTSSEGLTSTLADQINIDQSPTFVTAAGNVANVTNGSAIDVKITAFDPESAGDPSFELQSGTLPSGITLSSQSGGVLTLSGTAPSPASETTFNFVIRAFDAASNTTSRAFSIIVRPATRSSFTSSGTLAIPSGITSIDALVIAGGGGGGSPSGGGGGGAGGLIFMPGYPVSGPGTLTVTVGSGGSSNGDGQDSVLGSPTDPAIGQGGVLTAKGGGRGGSGGNGGSGGGINGPNGGVAGGSATQPTQPGNSGAYGFGNAGGPGLFDSSCNPTPTGPGPANGGGGGGAGGAGEGAHPSNHGGGGGVGKSYSIADGTTSVAYAAGGGGGGANQSLGQQICGIGGAGQGGNGNATSCGTANRGSGGGGVTRSGNCNGSNGGGKGVVIVAY